ncbi:MAG: alpha/beta fold hydrolase [Bryobacteraceae bacterium]
MFVKQYGSGQEVYFCLHGWSGDHRTFEPLVPFLPPQVRVYSADLPGCGSSAEPAEWNLASVTREIAEAFPASGVSFTVVGNCIGGLLGMRAALERPSAVGRLVLIDAFAAWPWYFRIFTAPGWGKYAYASTFANPLGRWITNGVLASRRSEQSNLTEGFASVRHDVALHYLEVLREIPSPAEFATLEIPVDLIFGARTFRAVRESAAVWRAMWPWARVWELPGAGHLPLREATTAVSEIVFQGVVCQPASAPTSNSRAL